MLRVQLEPHDKTGEQTGVKSVWKRREWFNLTYTFAGAIKSALFLFQHLSMLGYQESLERGKHGKNAENILRVRSVVTR